jgi:hypothetical protein
MSSCYGRVQIADEGVPRFVVARAREDERPDQRVAPRRARLGRQVRVARGVEQRDDLVDAVEVDGTLAGSSFRLAGVHPNRVACDQFAIGGDLEDLPEAGDRVVDRLEPTATPRRRRPTCRRPPSALA